MIDERRGITYGAADVRLTVKTPDGTDKEIGKIKDITLDASPPKFFEYKQPDPTPQYKHPGVDVVITDARFFPGALSSISVRGVLDMNKVTLFSDSVATLNRPFRLSDDYLKVDPRTITVCVNDNTRYAHGSYTISTNGYLYINDKIDDKDVQLEITAMKDDEEYTMLHDVLILPTSKMIPFHRLKDFTPDMYEVLKTDRLIAYTNKKHHIAALSKAANGNAYVFGYTIKKRGIYAKIKFYH